MFAWFVVNQANTSLEQKSFLSLVVRLVRGEPDKQQRTKIATSFNAKFAIRTLAIREVCKAPFRIANFIVRLVCG